MMKRQAKSESVLKLPDRTSSPYHFPGHAFEPHGSTQLLRGPHRRASDPGHASRQGRGHRRRCHASRLCWKDTRRNVSLILNPLSLPRRRRQTDAGKRQAFTCDFDLCLLPCPAAGAETAGDSAAVRDQCACHFLFPSSLRTVWRMPECALRSRGRAVAARLSLKSCRRKRVRSRR